MKSRKFFTFFFVAFGTAALMVANAEAQPSQRFAQDARPQQSASQRIIEGCRSWARDDQSFIACIQAQPIAAQSPYSGPQYPDRPITQRDAWRRWSNANQ
jgi:hypothetical protein